MYPEDPDTAQEEESEDDDQAASADAQQEEAPTERVGAFLRGGETGGERDNADKGAALHVTVVPANVVAVEVYQQCKMEAVAGMAGLVWLGIAARELLSALQLCNVPLERYEDTRMRVRIMEQAATSIHNERAEKRANEHRARVSK